MFCLGILHSQFAPSSRPRLAASLYRQCCTVVASESSATSTATTAHHGVSARPWRQDVDQLRELEAAGHAASVIEYAAAMSACREAGEGRCCELLLQRARRQHYGGRNSVPPTLHHFLCFMRRRPGWQSAGRGAFHCGDIPHRVVAAPKLYNAATRLQRHAPRKLRPATLSSDPTAPELWSCSGLLLQRLGSSRSGGLSSM